MKYPEKVEHQGVNYYGELKRGSIGTYIRYEEKSYFRTGKVGILRLPEGWQDMDRTWTAQDIYWNDKYDCKHVQGRALLIETV